MNTEPPHLDFRQAGRPAGDLDTLLRAYFTSEMPSPWPGAPTPDRLTASLSGKAERNGHGPPHNRPRRSPGVRPWSLRSSRLALAAGMTALLLGSWFLAGPFHGGAAPSPSFQLLPGAAEKDPLPPLPAAPGYRMKENLVQPFTEKAGPNGQVIREEKPMEFRIEFFPDH
jgi:hypothetical protein